MAIRRKLLKPKERQVENLPTQVEKPSPRVVPPMVTEIVDDNGEVLSPPLADIKRDAQDIEEKVEILAEEQHDIARENIEASAPKEVVADLFQPSGEVSIAPEISEYKKSSFRSMIIWVFVVLSLALITGSVLFVVVKGIPKSLPLVASPTPIPTFTPTPTPTPVVIERKDIKVQVVNGGGVAGAGSKMKKFLEDKGYVVISVTNAKEYTYDKTEIHVSSAKSSALTLLTNDLKTDYTLGETDASLSSEAASDAQIIVGK